MQISPKSILKMLDLSVPKSHAAYTTKQPPVSLHSHVEGSVRLLTLCEAGTHLYLLALDSCCPRWALSGDQQQLQLC